MTPDDDSQYQSLTDPAAPPATTSQQDDQTVESCLEMALPALESGMAPDQIINAMFGNLPEHIKQLLRARMGEAVAAKQAREHEMARQTRAAGQEAQARNRANFSLSNIAALISEQTLDRIKKIFMTQPQLAALITSEGAKLLRHGVTPEMIRLSEAQLGQLPVPTIGAPDRAIGEGRGV